MDCHCISVGWCSGHDCSIRAFSFLCVDGFVDVGGIRSAEKALMVDAVLSLAVETFLLMPLAVGYVAYLTAMGASHFSPTADPGLAAAFVATGVMAAVPLVAFTIGAMRLSLSVLGFIQYLAPILIVALGVFVFGEPFGAREILPLSFIWLGIAVFLAGQVREHKNSSQLRARS